MVVDAKQKDIVINSLFEKKSHRHTSRIVTGGGVGGGGGARLIT